MPRLSLLRPVHCLALICAAALPSAAQPAAPPLASLVAPPPAPPGLQAATEQEWVVRTIVERLWRLGHLPDRKSAPAPMPQLTVVTVAASPAVFVVTVGAAAPVTVRAANHLWDPRGYHDLARALALGAAPAAARANGAIAARGNDATTTARANDAPTTESDRLLQALTAPGLPVLLAEDARLAAALRAGPPSADAHEQAALLVGAFVLREGAGVFSDPRPGLSRMTAHLAVADVLRGDRPPGAAGVTAAALLAVEVGREREALTTLAPLAGTARPEPQQAWARALTMRATGDWRTLARPARASQLERYQFGRALAQRVGDHRLLEWMAAENQTPDVEWSRILLSTRFSVATGQVFGDVSLPLELAEAALLWGAYDQGSGDAVALVRALDDASRGHETRAVHVLDWPLVAAAAERHLAGRARSAYDHHANLGHPERMAALPQELRGRLPGLTLLDPAIVLMRDDGGRDHQAVEATRAQLRQRPWLFPPAAWNALADVGARRAPQAAWPSADVWFMPWVPDRTVMRPVDRSMRPGRGPKPPIPLLEMYHRDAPSDAWISWALAWWRVPGKPTLASVREHYGAILDYDVNALRSLLDDLDGTPDEDRQLATSMCELDTDYCRRLAEQLLLEGEDADAAAEYGRWFARARDRVGAANEVWWLAQYLFDNGRTDEARRVADSAGEVGSARGMETQAQMLDRFGQHADAEALYRKITERYEGWGAALGSFHLRRWQRTGDASDRALGLALVRDRFPAGLEPAPTGGPAPADGLKFNTFGRRAERSGLRRGDIIVGMNGYRVRSVLQSWVVLRLSFDPDMTYTVWRDGTYTQVKAIVAQRTLGAILADYRAPAESR